ncbi:hypothetical protein JCM19045_2875 [Bacillus sp. JCM 19045]|nr:hypothetical protein JCM19045_2875 [Bacillus sp. JCM 19045]
MNLLFLKTSYGGVYPSFETALVNGFKSHATVLEKPLRSFKHPVHLEQFCHQHRIDWIFMLVGNEIKEAFYPSFVEDRLPPLAVWFTEDPYLLQSSKMILPLAKLVFTVELSVVSTYEKASKGSVVHLPLGFDPSSYFPPKKNGQSTYDLCFVGYPYPNRVKLLELICSKQPIQVAVAGPWQKDQLPKQAEHIATWLPPKETGALYRRSKVVLNTYRPATLKENESILTGQSINNRTFEIAACQSFQLTEWKPDIHTFFQKESLSTFSTHNQCLEAIQFALSNETWRNKVALAGYETVSNRDSFQKRADRIVKEMSSHLLK